MNEKQLICQLKKLKDVKPRKDWIVLTKDKLFEEPVYLPAEKKEQGIISAFSTFMKELQRSERFVFQHKLAFSSALMIAVFFGLFGFVQNSVPGESLFSIKKIAEESQAVFVGQSHKSIHNLEIANKRLDDLTKIAKGNDVKKLAPALVEYNETVSKAAKTLSQAGSVQEIALEIKKLHEKEEMIRSLGIELDNNEDLDNAIIILVKREIDALKQRELNESQQQALVEIEQELAIGNYSLALEKILMIER